MPKLHDDIDVEDEYEQYEPFCECENTPVEEELATNQCMGCGKPLN